MPEGFIDELRNALDKGTVLSGGDIDARYHHDLAGNPVPKPRAVVRPRTTEDVSALLRLCHREGVPVTTQGGMTGLVRGALPNANEIVLSMERMNSVEEVDASAGVAIAQAGTPLQKLQERVEQDGLMFPLDLGARGSCTIGGNISTNAGGNRVIRYGMMRDLVLGLEVVTADGTVLKGLRKYIKNNTGIDLKQLFIGSEGILGVVTRAALRVFPAPAERQVALCALPSFGQVMTFLKLARKSLGGDLTAFEVMWNAYYRQTVERVKGVAGPLPTHHPFYVLLEASGSDAERIHADLERTAGDGDGRRSDPRRHALDLECIRRRDLAHPRFQRRTRPQLSITPRGWDSMSVSPSTGWRNMRIRLMHASKRSIRKPSPS